jgi:predicted transcriptional regulator/ribosome-associated translation inhibitor RaiA
MSYLKLLAQSSVREVSETDCPTIPNSANVSKLISLLNTSESDEAIVTNGFPPKIVTIRDILKVTHPDKTSVSNIASSPPNITPDTRVYDASRKMVQNRVRILPVTENESVVGVVRQTKILEKMADCKDMGDCASENLMVENLITVQPDFSIGVIRSIMLKNGISHTPIVERDGKLKGIITAKDLVSQFIKPSESETVGELKGENIRIWDMGTRIIESSPLQVTRRTRILDVIHEMLTLKKGYCLVIEKNKPIGIITPRDILSLLAQFEPVVQIPVYVIGFKDCEKDLVQSATRKIELVAARALKTNPDLEEIIVDGKAHSTGGEETRFTVKARAYMSSKILTVTAESWSLQTVFDEIGAKLDARLRQKKEKRSQKGSVRADQ